MALLFKRVAAAVLLVFLYTPPLVAHSDSVATSMVKEALNRKPATGEDFRTHKPKAMDCKACRAATRASFGGTQHFVGENVDEAVDYFCAELKYRGFIRDKDIVKCSSKIIKQANKSGRYKYGVSYIKANDVCAFYGACQGKTM